MKAFYTIVVLLLSFLFFSFADAQEFDLGPIPGVEIKCLAVPEQPGSKLPNLNPRGSWTQFRGDRKLTGRSELIGSITCPELLWSLDLGARRSFFSITPDAGNSVFQLPVTGEMGDRFQVQRDFEGGSFGRLIDLDGDGLNRVDPSGPTHKIGNFVPDDPDSLYRASCFHEGNPGDDQNQPLSCYLQRRQNSEWVMVWESNPLRGFTLGHTVAAQNIIADIDNDGDLEMVAIGWWEVYVFDLLTGTLEQTGVFWDGVDPPTPRGYGWMGAINLDQDPRLEIVIIGDFEKFISVIGWKGDKFEEIWDYAIEVGTTDDQSLHYTGVNPLRDVDGDGQFEIITSIFNEADDHRWHIVGRDALSGQQEFDIEDAVLAGLGDLDGDAVAELFITHSSGSVIPTIGTIEILSFLSQVKNVIWSDTSAGFPSLPVPDFPLHINSASTLYKKSMFFRQGWIVGAPVFVTSRGLEGMAERTLDIHQWNGSEIEVIGSVSGSRLKLMSLPSSTPEKGMLVRSMAESIAQSSLQLSSVTAMNQASGHITDGDGPDVTFNSSLTATVAGKLTVNGQPIIITQDYNQMIRAYSRQGQTKPPIEIWRITGRGMGVGVGNRNISTVNGFSGVLLADLLGTGDLVVAIADKATDGRARIKAVDSKGKTIWEHVFDVPGEPAGQSAPGLIHWLAGKFTTSEREDLAIVYRTAFEGSEVMELRNGTTGELIWLSTFGGFSACGTGATGTGGTHMPVFDWDSDGLDDILNNWRNMFTVYKGSTGEILINLSNGGEGCPEPNPDHIIFSENFDALPMTVVADFLGNGSQRVLYTKNEVTLALLNTQGVVQWNTPLYQGHAICCCSGSSRSGR